MARPQPVIPSGGFYNGLPPEAQRKILRDFQSLAAAIIPSPTMFDAIIDPAIITSSPSTHQYINLTELVAHESWSAGTLFNIGVMERGHIGIVEALGSGSLDVSSKGDIALFGLSDFTGGIGSRTAWDWCPLNMAVGQQLFLHNLSFTITVIAT